MRPYIVLVLLLASTLVLWAAPDDLVVTVIDQDLGTPLEGVRLTVRGVEGKFQTDAEGKASIGLPAGIGTVLIAAALPGYEPKKALARAGDHTLLIKLSLSGFVEGGELVVEKPKPKVTDAQAGVSQVVTKEDITNTTMGVVEDLMSTIKTLPGVGYSGNFGIPSIQGGNPNEMIAVLDGAYVLYPYHWGGAVSIFNPDMVESAKLSDGIVSASYGQFLSGVLEVNSITPNKVQPTVDFGLSTTGLDCFVSSPLSENAGLFIGGKTTWLQVPLSLFGAAQDAPYITEGYTKLYWDPTPDVKLFLNGYLGTDGVNIGNSTIRQPTPPDTLSTSGSIGYSDTEALATAGAKLLLSDDLLLNLLLSFNDHNQSFDAQSVTSGTQYYDQNFINTYSPGATSFTLNDLTDTRSGSTTDYLYQAKSDLDWEFAQGQLLSVGMESVLRNSTTSTYVNGWQTVYTGSTPQFLNVVSNVSTAGDNTLTSALYADYSFSMWSGLVSGEAGVRGNYTVVYDSDMSLLTQPSVDPRLRLMFTPIRDRGPFKSFSFVAGTGLFSQFPVDDPYIDKKYGLSDYQIGPTRAWFNELGIQAVTEDDWKLEVDGYYKSYYDRFYVIEDETATPATYSTYSDGTGFAYGLDFSAVKNSRFWDVSLSYSYVITRLFNPGQPGNTDTDGDPTGIWYYPSYNYIHNLNLVLTLKPTNGFSFTTEAQIVSGAPLQQVGPVTSYMTTLPDGTVVERFSRTSSYSDSLRTGWSFPVDVKASWHGYFRDSKIGWEFYLAVQDIFARLYTSAANGNPPFDPWTGQSLSGTAAATYSSGFPIPSIGYTLHY